MLEETHPDYSFLFLHIEHIVSRAPLFVRYRTVRCASAYGFYRIYSRASEYRVDATLPRAVRRPVRCGAASSLPRVMEAADVSHHSDSGRQHIHSGGLVWSLRAGRGLRRLWRGREWKGGS